MYKRYEGDGGIESIPAADHSILFTERFYGNQVHLSED